jgi:hypothetical protein
MLFVEKQTRDHQIIILSEISPTKTNIEFFFFFVEARKRKNKKQKKENQGHES